MPDTRSSYLSRVTALEARYPMLEGTTWLTKGDHSLLLNRADALLAYGVEQLEAFRVIETLITDIHSRDLRTDQIAAGWDTDPGWNADDVSAQSQPWLSPNDISYDPTYTPPTSN